jgi:hypothetical protein
MHLSYSLVFVVAYSFCFLLSAFVYEIKSFCLKKIPGFERQLKFINLLCIHCDIPSDNHEDIRLKLLQIGGISDSVRVHVVSL